MHTQPAYQGDSPYAPPSARVEEVFDGGEQELASRWSRLGAWLINGLLLSVPAFVVGMVAGAGAVATTQGGGGLVGFVFFIIGALAIYYLGLLLINLLWLSRYGQSVGKRWLKIRIVRRNGAPAGLARLVFLRYLSIYIGAMILGLLGFLASAADPGASFQFLGNLLFLIDILLIFGAARLCLHDRIADTKVVKVVA